MLLWDVTRLAFLFGLVRLVYVSTYPADVSGEAKNVTRPEAQVQRELASSKGGGAATIATSQCPLHEAEIRHSTRRIPTHLLKAELPAEDVCARFHNGNSKSWRATSPCGNIDRITEPSVLLLETRQHRECFLVTPSEFDRDLP